MRVFLKKKIGAIHDMEGRKALMRNNLEGLIRKNTITKWEKNQITFKRNVNAL